MLGPCYLKPRQFIISPCLQGVVATKTCRILCLLTTKIGKGTHAYTQLFYQLWNEIFHCMIPSICISIISYKKTPYFHSCQRKNTMKWLQIFNLWQLFSHYCQSIDTSVSNDHHPVNIQLPLMTPETSQPSMDRITAWLTINQSWHQAGSACPEKAGAKTRVQTLCACGQSSMIKSTGQ